MKLTFFETSAKDNKNVYEAFYAITRSALQRRLEARAKAQEMQHNDKTNDGISSQTVRLKTSKKSKK
ncbi:unnamed protein product, partial [Rotaria magnacalcarata]